MRVELLSYQWLQSKAAYTLNLCQQQHREVTIWQNFDNLKGGHMVAVSPLLFSLVRLLWKQLNDITASITSVNLPVCHWFKHHVSLFFLLCLLDLERAKFWQQIYQGNYLNYLPVLCSCMCSNIEVFVQCIIISHQQTWILMLFDKSDSK